MSKDEILYLRKIKHTDTKDIIRWRNDDNIKKFFIYQKDITEEGHLKWIKEMIDTGKAVQFIICNSDDNAKIGSVYLRDIDIINRKAEFGIFIGEREYLGRGYGRIATKQILEYGFNELRLHKIFLRVLLDNIQAIKAYRSVGFVEEGIFRDDVLINNKYRDIMFMSIVDPNE